MALDHILSDDSTIRIPPFLTAINAQFCNISFEIVRPVAVFFIFFFSRGYLHPNIVSPLSAGLLGTIERYLKWLLGISVLVDSI